MLTAPAFAPLRAGRAAAGGVYHVIGSHLEGHPRAACSWRTVLEEVGAATLIPEHHRCTRAGCAQFWPGPTEPSQLQQTAELAVRLDRYALTAVAMRRASRLVRELRAAESQPPPPPASRLARSAYEPGAGSKLSCTCPAEGVAIGDWIWNGCRVHPLNARTIARAVDAHLVAFASRAGSSDHAEGEADPRQPRGGGASVARLPRAGVPGADPQVAPGAGPTPTEAPC